MEFLAICIIIGVVIGIFGGKSANAASSSSKPNLPQKVEAKCPFCGLTNAKFYVPGKEPYPQIHKCSDCMRYYGNTAAMTPAEKQLVENSNNACQRIDQMPELDFVMNTIVSHFKNYRRGGTEYPTLTIKDGKVEVWNHTGAPRRVLCTYTKTTEIGDQHLTMMCYNRIKREMPYSSFTFGNWWVDMELYKN